MSRRRGETVEETIEEIIQKERWSTIYLEDFRSTILELKKVIKKIVSDGLLVRDFEIEYALNLISEIKFKVAHIFMPKRPIGQVLLQAVYKSLDKCVKALSILEEMLMSKMISNKLIHYLLVFEKYLILYLSLIKSLGGYTVPVDKVLEELSKQVVELPEPVRKLPSKYQEILMVCAREPGLDIYEIMRRLNYDITPENVAKIRNILDELVRSGYLSTGVKSGRVVYIPTEKVLEL